MKQLAAMRETLALARANPWEETPEDNAKGASIVHLQSMLDRVEEDQLRKKPEMSAAKIGRWLGWMQAVVALRTPFTLEDMKKINMRNRK